MSSNKASLEGIITSTNKHYDQDPKLFETFLGSTMKYSEGIFSEGIDSLDKAQMLSLESTIQNLRLGHNKSLLDVGCGWGSLSLLAAQKGINVVAITPAPHQADYIRKKACQMELVANLKVIVGDQKTILPELFEKKLKFDAISWIGSIVHVLDKSTAIKICSKLLHNSGRFYISESCYKSHSIYKEFILRSGSQFVSDEIFGKGYMTPLSSYIEQFENNGLTIEGLKDLSLDYKKTINYWTKNVIDAREKIGDKSAERFIKYFKIANAGWGFTTKHYAFWASKKRL